MKSCLREYFIGILLLLCFLFGCKNHKNELDQFFKKKINLTSIGIYENVIDLKIVNDTAIVRTINANKVPHNFMVDLKTKKVIKLGELGDSSDVVMYEYYNGKIMYTSIVHPDTLLILNVKNGRTEKLKIDVSKVFSSTDLVVNLKQIFFLRNIYRIVVYHKSGFDLSLKNKLGITNQIRNLISIPVSENVNLLSGDNIGFDKGYLYAIDNNNKVIWQDTIVTHSYDNDPSIFNCQHGFYVINGLSVKILNKTNGKEILERKFNKPIKSALILNDKIVLTFLSNDKVIAASTPKHLTILILDLNNLALKSKFSFNVIGDLDIGLVNQKLVVTDENNCRILNLKEGKIEMIKWFSKNEENVYHFRAVRDMHSNKYYMLTYNNDLYW